jgi:hypothetical protein
MTLFSWVRVGHLVVCWRFATVVKIYKKTERKDLFLAHNFRGYRPWSAGCIALGLW